MALNTKLIDGLLTIIQPFTFIPSSPYYHQEEWRVIMPCYILGIEPNRYWISTYGRVYDTKSTNKYPNGHFKKIYKNYKGYSCVSLGNSTINDNTVSAKLSRLVMLHFAFVPGCHLLEVDHLDGNKDNNCIWNLEWVTPQENTHRAIINGQRLINCHRSNIIKPIKFLLTDQQARELFMKALNGYNRYELSKEYIVSEDYIKDLLAGAVRPYIRKEYFSKIN